MTDEQWQEAYEEARKKRDWPAITALLDHAPEHVDVRSEAASVLMDEEARKQEWQT